MPFKRVKFARKATQLMTTKLITVPEMLARLDPQRMVPLSCSRCTASAPSPHRLHTAPAPPRPASTPCFAPPPQLSAPALHPLHPLQAAAMGDAYLDSLADRALARPRTGQPRRPLTRRGSGSGSRSESSKRSRGA